VPTPLISVVVPAYNHQDYIAAAIESVLNQTVRDLELIIVDDGSTDNTAAVIKGYTDKRISYTWQENQDAFNTINRGMSMARGRYISILNSDDIYALDRLEKLVAVGEERNAACLFTDVIPISDDGLEFTDPGFGWNVWHRKNREYFRKHEDIYTGFLHGNYMVTTSNLFLTAEAVRRVGNFAPIRYLHDYDYMFRVLLEFPESVFYLEHEKLLYYRIHQGNTLSEAAITGRQQDLEVIEKYMLAKIPQQYRNYVKTGSQRLRALENEIAEVQAELETTKTAGKFSISSTPGLLERIKNRCCRAFCSR
jgi:glycosyltransferase involved in cell wall biosynthesis